MWHSQVWTLEGAVFATLLAALLTVGADGPLAIALPLITTGAALGVAGWAVRRTRTERAAYEARLLMWAATEATLAERLRVARDLHDIVSHGLGLITVRAAAARYTSSSESLDVAQARTALADIETASRKTTTELRRMLTVLRSQDAVPPPIHPIEGLDLIPDIVRSAELGGLRPRLMLEPLGEVSQGVQVAVCRVVRESLSNALRHAGPSDVHIDVYRDQATIVVKVSDTGPDRAWQAAPGAGLGLMGLRERVAALGGTLHFAAVESGFRVTAQIPDEVAS